MSICLPMILVFSLQAELLFCHIFFPCWNPPKCTCSLIEPDAPPSAIIIGYRSLGLTHLLGRLAKHVWLSSAATGCDLILSVSSDPCSLL